METLSNKNEKDMDIIQEIMGDVHRIKYLLNKKFCENELSRGQTSGFYHKGEREKLDVEQDSIKKLYKLVEDIEKQLCLMKS